MSLRRRALLIPAMTAGLVLGLAAPAAAHIHTDPAAIEAGTAATVSLVIEHGCEGSPTTGMSLLLPEGTTEIEAGEVEGFTASTDGLEVAFTGGSVPDGTEQAFPVSFTAPSEPGDVLIKVVQTCDDAELAWIDEPTADGTEPESPAPVLLLTDGPPTEADLAHGEEEAAPSGDHHEGAASNTSGGDADAGDTESAAPATETDPSDDDGSSTGIIAFGVVIVVVLGAAGVILLRRRGPA